MFRASPELLPDKADLWQSGKVESDKSLFVKYEGSKLASKQKVYWQVKFWDNKGNESKWSEKAFFELVTAKYEMMAKEINHLSKVNECMH